MVRDAGPIRVGVGCEFTFRCEAPTPSVLMVRPKVEADRSRQNERWTSTPDLPARDGIDAQGNEIRRLTLPPAESTLRYDAVVTASPLPDATDPDAAQVPPDQLPDDLLVYTLPSRFCPSDALADEAWRLFGGAAPGWPRVQAISDWVHENVRFAYGASTASTSAADTYALRSGVCRDFAQLAIAFCRALNIPARYAFGYLPDIGVTPPDAPMDFCAWMEVYLASRWWTFDPRNNQRRIGHIVIGRGRDAADVPMITSFGRATLLAMNVWADQIA